MALKACDEYLTKLFSYEPRQEGPINTSRKLLLASPVDIQDKFLLLFYLDCASLFGLIRLACHAYNKLDIIASFNRGLDVNSFALMTYLRVQCFIKLSTQLQTRLPVLVLQAFYMLRDWQRECVYADEVLLAFVFSKLYKHLRYQQR